MGSLVRGLLLDAPDTHAHLISSRYDVEWGARYSLTRDGRMTIMTGMIILAIMLQ